MQAAGQGGLDLVRTIDLPRVEGGISHLEMDLWTGRLYVAAFDGIQSARIELHGVLATDFADPAQTQPRTVAFAADISAADVWKVVHYVKTLRRQT